MEEPQLIACGTSPTCLHAPCGLCGKPMRQSGSRNRRIYAADHPGTIQHRADGLCVTCLYQRKLSPEDLADQGHIRLPARDMARIKRLDPQLHDWHLQRRKNMAERKRKRAIQAQKRRQYYALKQSA